MSERATVVAVCLSDKGGVPKYPQPYVTVGQYGVEGDYHSGATRTNSRGETVANERQVSVVAVEAIEAAASALEVEIPHGGVGENVLVRGLGDLSELAPGERLVFGSGVELKVTGQNDPCANLCVYHAKVPKLLYGRRGVLATVEKTGTLRPGDTVSVKPGGNDIDGSLC